MVVPNLDGAPLKANKLELLVKKAQLRNYLLRERVLLRVAKEVVPRDDGKYFFADVRTERLKNLPINPLLTSLQEIIQSPSCPSRADIEALKESKAMGAFDLIRLHLAFTEPALAGTDAEKILASYGLRVGLPRNSVVPAIRVFDPKTFDKVQQQVGSLKQIATVVTRRSGRNLNSIEAGLNNLRTGYKRRGENSGLYRITTKHARLYHEALVELADGRPANVPALDVLFSFEPEIFPYGAKLGTKPLEKIDGALI